MRKGKSNHEYRQTGKASRSSKYQRIYNETSLANVRDYMDGLSEGFGSKLDETQLLARELYPQEPQELVELRDRLSEELWKIVDDELTPLQSKMIKLYYCEGLTQTEIGCELGIGQSAVYKCLKGNAIYYKGSKNTYGGALRSLKKRVASSRVIQSILAEIAYWEAEPINPNERNPIEDVANDVD